MEVAPTSGGMLEVSARGGSAWRWLGEGFEGGNALHALMTAATRTVVARTGSVTGGKGILFLVSYNTPKNSMLCAFKHLRNMYLHGLFNVYSSLPLNRMLPALLAIQRWAYHPSNVRDCQQRKFREE